MPQGVIKWYSPIAKAGFITPVDFGPDVFFVKNVVEEEEGIEELPVGATVEYKTIETRRGPHASTILLIDLPT